MGGGWDEKDEDALLHKDRDKSQHKKSFLKIAYLFLMTNTATLKRAKLSRIWIITVAITVKKLSNLQIELKWNKCSGKTNAGGRGGRWFFKFQELFWGKN